MSKTEELKVAISRSLTMSKQFIEGKERWYCLIYYLTISSENEITYIIWNTTLWSNKKMIWPLCTVLVIGSKYIIVTVANIMQLCKWLIQEKIQNTLRWGNWEWL